jgi:hypothetical protein
MTTTEADTARPAANDASEAVRALETVRPGW